MPAARSTLKTFAYALILVSAVFSVLYLFARPTRWFATDESMAEMQNDFAIAYRNVTLFKGKKSRTALMSGSRTILLFFLGTCTLVAAFSACIVCYLNQQRTPAAHRQHRTLWRHMKGFLAKPIPPRGLWDMCGGVSVSEAIFMALWLAMQVVWFYEGYMKALDPTIPNPFAGHGGHGHHAKKVPRSEVKFDKASAEMGAVYMLNSILVLYPVPRSNFLQWIFQADFPQLVKYHRWIGWATLITGNLHGVMYWALWIYQGNFVEKAFEWPVGGINNLAGGVCTLCTIPVMITVLPYFRRHFYNLFYRTHIAGFILYIFFGIVHHKGNMAYFIPGMAMYLMDLTFRFCQSCVNRSYVRKVVVSGSGNMVTLYFDWMVPAKKVSSGTTDTAKGVDLAPLPAGPGHIYPTQDIFIKVPAISTWQWHPATIAGVHVNAPPGHKGGPLMISTEVHLKRLGPWTSALVEKAKLLEGPGLEVEVQGPYGRGGGETECLHYSTVVLCGGSSGVTPLLGLLQMIASVKRDCPDAGPQRVYLVWTTRDMHEFTILDCNLLTSMASWDEDEQGKDQPGKPLSSQWLRMKLHHTGLSPTVPNLPPLMKTAGNGNEVKGVEELPQAVPLLPYGFGLFHWAGAALLAMLGIFAGIFPGSVYDTHLANTTKVGANSSYVVLLWCLGCFLGATLPVLVITLPLYLRRRMKWSKMHLGADIIPRKVQVLSEKLVGCAEMGVSMEVQHGRPMWGPILESVCNAQARGPEPDGTIGVFAGGPPGMVKSVRDAVSSVKGGGGIDFHSHTFEL